MSAARGRHTSGHVSSKKIRILAVMSAVRGRHTSGHVSSKK